MSEENLDDFKKKKELLEKEKKSVENSLEITHNTIDKEAQKVRELKNIKERMWGISRIYDDSDERQIAIMPQLEYGDFIDPLRKVTVAGASVLGVEEESRFAFNQAENHLAILTATTSTTGSDLCPALNVVGRYPTYFKNPETIIREVKVIDESQHQIGYIKSELSNITPDINKDFDMFLKKYDAFKIDKTKYQDFIAARSMLFFKLIFEPFEKTPGAETRIKQIRFFVFGKDVYNASVEPQIQRARELYGELSNQERSVKTGELDPTKADDTFKRIVAVLYSLLVLRDRYFSKD